MVKTVYKLMLLPIVLAFAGSSYASDITRLKCSGTAEYFSPSTGYERRYQLTMNVEVQGAGSFHWITGSSSEMSFTVRNPAPPIFSDSKVTWNKETWFIFNSADNRAGKLATEFVEIDRITGQIKYQKMGFSKFDSMFTGTCEKIANKNKF